MSHNKKYTNFKTFHQAPTYINTYFEFNIGNCHFLKKITIKRHSQAFLYYPILLFIRIRSPPPLDFKQFSII